MFLIRLKQILKEVFKKIKLMAMPLLQKVFANANHDWQIAF